MNFSETLKHLRLSENLKQEELAKIIGVSRSAISMYERGEREPDFETMETIANHFNVSMDYLHGMTDDKGHFSCLIKCPDCGLEYYANSEKDFRYHRNYHKNVMKAMDTYKELVVFPETEQLKNEARKVIQNKNSSCDATYNAWIDIFKSYFSRSLYGCNFNLNHVDFVKYVSMLLHQPHFQNEIDSATFDRLTSKFGTSSGMKNATTYYECPTNFSYMYQYENIIPLPKMKRVPLLGTIACGEPILATENIECDVDMPENIRADFALRCKGDSMVDANIYNGDIVYIRQQPIVDNGEIAAVLIGDEATLKRFYQNGDTVTLMPCNTKYTPFVYSGQQIEEIQILGKAVGFTSTNI